MKIAKNDNQSHFDRLLEKAKALKKTRKEGDLTKALELIEQAEKLEVSHPRLLSIKAKCLKNLGRLEEALRVARKNYENYRTTINLSVLSKILSMLNRTSETIDATDKFCESKQVKKKETFDLIQKANSLKRSTPLEALSILEKSAIVDPFNIYASGIRCECLMSLKRNEAALEEARKGVEILSNDISYNLLAKSLIANGKYIEALEAAKKAVDLTSIDIIWLFFSWRIAMLDFRKKLERYSKFIMKKSLPMT